MYIGKKAILFVMCIVFLLSSSAVCFAAQPVTIEFWHAMRGEKHDAIVKLVNKFMQENPDIRVKEVPVVSPDSRRKGNDYNYLYDQLLRSLAMQKQPDIAQVYENWATQFIEIEAITPVNRFDGTRYAMTREDMNDFYPIFREASSYNGTMWTVPFNKSIYVLYYNRNMFKEKGLTPPRTWNELRDAASKLTVREGDETKQYGIVFTPSVDIFGHVLYANGGQFIRDDVAVFDTGREDMNYWVSLTNKDRSALPSFGAFNDFMAGKAAMYIETTSRIGVLEANCPFPFGISSVPSGKKTVYQCAGTNLANFAGTEEKKLAAWRLIKFLTNRENTIVLATETGYLPVRQSAYQSPEYQKYLQTYPGYKVGVESLKYGVSQPRNSAWEAIRGFINDAMYEAISQSSTPEKALEKAVNNSNGLLRGARGQVSER